MNPKVYIRSVDGNIDKDYVRKKLIEVDIAPGDSIMCSCRLPFLGTLGENTSFADFSNLLIDEILDIIGPDGTMVVPAYSYTFCEKQEFDPLLTPSTLGIFFETFRKMNGVVRTLDPIFSVCIIGKQAKFLSGGNNDDCFGKDSFFDRFHSLCDAKYLLIGLNYHYITGFHHIEQICNVKHRFIKEFSGTIVTSNAEKIQRVQKYFVRDLNQNYDFEPLFKYIAEYNLSKNSVFGNSTIKMIKERVFFETVTKLLRTNERCFLK